MEGSHTGGCVNRGEARLSSPGLPESIERRLLDHYLIRRALDLSGHPGFMLDTGNTQDGAGKNGPAVLDKAAHMVDIHVREKDMRHVFGTYAVGRKYFHDLVNAQFLAMPPSTRTVRPAV